MGGRGASSSRGGSGGGGGITSLDDSGNFSQMQQYFQDKYGVPVNSSVGTLPRDAQQAYLGGIDSALSEYPGLASTITDVRVEAPARGRRSGSLVGAQANMGTGVISINPKASNISSFDASSVKRLTTHEVGHLLESRIAREKWKNSDAALRAMRAHDVAGSAVVAAADKAGARTIKARKNALRSISYYASAGGNGEAFAEAFADTVVNKNNAKPLSKAIMGEVSEYTKHLKHGGNAKK